MTVSHVDPELKSYATERQGQIIDAINEHGSQVAAAAALGVNESSIRKSLDRLKACAAMRGYAPDFSMKHPVPATHVAKGVSTLYDEDGKVRMQWVKSSLNNVQLEEAIRAAAEAFSEELPRMPPSLGNYGVIGGPRPSSSLCNVFTMTDCHVGMLAWRKEGGEDWDLKIAEETLTRCFEQMILRAPDAGTAVVNQLGDFLHSDGLLPVTPTSGHILDQDGRFSKMVGVSIRVLRRVIDCALAHHERVIVLMAEGNHDMASSVWLRLMFAALYENEPRVNIVDSELPYYAIQHGQTMLAFHHGHLKKPDEFPLTFAAQYPAMWGQTTKRYAHAGHMHHKYVKEHGGMTVTQHPTLAARDAYAARGGWFAERAAICLTYHATYGQVAETTITPEMVE